MSLEKWLKTEKKKAKEKPEKSENKTISKEEDTKSRPQSILKFKKYILVCSKPKCKYQKTIMKNKLSERDKICPRCNSKMKEK